MSSRHKYLKLSEDEAREILEEEVRDKDFWAVDDTYDNYDKLQSVLDVLFNTLEGNRYKVAYQENQNGTRLQIQCLICSKDLTSYDPFITHENGKNHKKVRQQQLVPQDPNLARKLELRKHNEPREIFPTGSLEDQIDSTPLLVLGIQFVYKEVIRGQDTYSCQLCRLSQVSSSRMFSHLTSDGHGSHNAKYLEVKYGFMKKSRAETEQYGRSVEEREGKVHTLIVDFTKQLPPDMTAEPLKGMSPGARSHSKSHSKSRGHHSPARRSSSPMSSDNSRSPSPWESRPSLHTSLPQPPPVPPPPITASVAVTADLSEFPRPILKEVKILQEVECKETVQEDTDMQGLLFQTLWVLNSKMLRYYQRSGAFYMDSNVRHRLDGSAMKIEQYITRLDILKEENGN